MLVSEMRTAMDSAIHGTDSYTASDKDRAFQFAGEEFIRRTGCTQTSGTKATVSGTNTLDISSISNLLPHRVNRVAISDKQLKVVTYSVLDTWNDSGDTASGEPTHISFLSKTEVLVWPNPDAVYTVKFWFREPLLLKNVSTGAVVTWTIGSTDASITAAEFNIPDEYCRTVLLLGAVPAMVMASPGVLLRAGAWDRFEEYMESIEGESQADVGVWLPNEADFIDV